MDSAGGYTVKGDRALRSEDQDRLGFREVATRVAASLIDSALEEGIVVGLDGPWGSGKSSLLFLVIEEFKTINDAARPEIIAFQPWLIGDRDALITSFFKDLSRSLDRIAAEAGDSVHASSAKAKEAARALRGFVRGVRKAGSAIEFVGDVSGMSALRWAGKGVRAVGELADEPAARSLSDLKVRLADALRELGRRFVVTIDDVDRLEPLEVVEILRLIRSVADLPNVVYVLCYDASILSRSIERAIGVECGRSFLEKIVQLTVMVPIPESFQLRQWFSDELKHVASPKDDEEASRLAMVIDYEGGRRLKTPRSVIRALDSIRFYWASLRVLRADLADLVWIQLIKNDSPDLYRWIEEYCAIAAALSLGAARVEDVERKKQLAALMGVVEVGHFDDVTYRQIFSEQLLGVEVQYNEGGTFELFTGINSDGHLAAVGKCRLASPDHYRMYFSLTGPSHALKKEDIDAVTSASDLGAREAAAELLSFHRQSSMPSLTKLDLFLDRLRSGSIEILESRRVERILLALSMILDDVYKDQQQDVMWVNSTWYRAETITAKLLMASLDRRAVLKKMFLDGAAIGWLTSIFRSETFSHGRFGERRRDENTWILSDEELDMVTELLLARYRAMTVSEVLQTPRPISLLFAWQQGGDEVGPRNIVSEYIRSDEGLLLVLEGLLTTVTSSDRGRYLVLKRENLAPFLEYDLAKKRIDEMVSDKKCLERAVRLKRAFEDGSHD